MSIASFGLILVSGLSQELGKQACRICGGICEESGQQQMSGDLMKLDWN